MRLRRFKMAVCNSLISLCVGSCVGWSASVASVAVSCWNRCASVVRRSCVGSHISPIGIYIPPVGGGNIPREYTGQCAFRTESRKVERDGQTGRLVVNNFFSPVVVAATRFGKLPFARKVAGNIGRVVNWEWC